MNSDLNAWMQLIFRWIHVVAGVIWLGHLYFFNFVNAHVAKTYDAAAKQKVAPELMPRALYWFRMGAAWTWVTGLVLAGLVYYMGGALFAEPGQQQKSGPWLGIFVVVLMVGFVVYNFIMKAVKNVGAASAICLLLLAATWALFDRIAGFSGRALYIHMGAILGTMMAGNVWMIIWPAQRKILAALKEGSAPDADKVALAGLRSRQNTYMSIPLIFTMISNHYPNIYGSENSAIYFAILTAVGFIAARLLLAKSAQIKGF